MNLSNPRFGVFAGVVSAALPFRSRGREVVTELTPTEFVQGCRPYCIKWKLFLELVQQTKSLPNIAKGEAGSVADYIQGCEVCRKLILTTKSKFTYEKTSVAYEKTRVKKVPDTVVEIKEPVLAKRESEVLIASNSRGKA